MTPKEFNDFMRFQQGKNCRLVRKGMTIMGKLLTGEADGKVATVVIQTTRKIEIFDFEITEGHLSRQPSKFWNGDGVDRVELTFQ